MDKKKEYIAPEMETVELKARVNLLGDSLVEGDEVGLAPHEQDPLA